MSIEQIEDGGLAYPNWEGKHYTDQRPHGGMTLRDYFAGKAMEAVPMPQSDLHDTAGAYDRIAKHAYKMADAMLRARKEKPL